MTPGFIRFAPTAGPSRWLLVAGRRFVAAVESTVSDSIVDAVFWLADSELATIESVVGAFPLSGPDSVRSFAVAELGPADAGGEVVVTAVVRGSAAVDVFSIGGARRFSAGGVQPWVLAEFRGVTGLVLCGEDAATGPVARLARGSLPLAIGVVDGELLSWSTSPIERVERTTPPLPREAPAEAVEETIIRGRSAGSSLFLHPEELPAPEAVPVAHELPGAVDIEAPPESGLPAAPTTTARDTPASQPSPETAEGLPATEPVQLPPEPARFAVRLPSGDIVSLDEPVVIGRRPALPRVGSAVTVRMVVVPSPNQEVSGSHVRIEQTGDAVVVTDLRSTNGTVVSGTSGTLRLRPGESTVVLEGARVSIGDGNIIEITARRDEGRE